MMRLMQPVLAAVLAAGLCGGAVPATSTPEIEAPRPTATQISSLESPTPHLEAPPATPTPDLRPSASSADAPTLAGCQMLPADNIWNTPVDNLPIHPRSSDYVAKIGAEEHVHADFGSGEWEGGPIGIPYVVVPGTQPGIDVSFYWDDQSDLAPY